MANNYSNLSKEELLKVVEKLESRKKYGLIWDEERTKEQFEKESDNALPVLKEVKNRDIKTDSSKPINILIEGDNYHALSVLNYTHKSKVDLIYIDPPYNRGDKDFKYNDKYIDSEDSYKHSKWLSFIKKRLYLAKQLLKDSGLILISIDDNEVAQLKLLCDEIYGTENFIAMMVWEGGLKNDSKFVSLSHDYILCYAKSKTNLKDRKVIWRVKKKGIDEINKAVKYLLKKNKNNYVIVSEKIKEWYAGLDRKHPSWQHKHYNYVDNKGIYFAGDISAESGRSRPLYEVIHPITKKPCKAPVRGWPTKDTLNQWINEGRIHWGENEMSVPKVKRYLHETGGVVIPSVIYKDRRAARKLLKNILGGDYFDNPKDVDVLKLLIESTVEKGSVILDFFAGSGTTAQAVLELNRDDDNLISFIMCTNNEVNEETDKELRSRGLKPGDIAYEKEGICQKACYPRISKIIKGYNDLNGKAVKGTNGNLKYFKTAFVKRSISKDSLRSRITQECTEMLCLREGIFDEIKKTRDYRIYQYNNHAMGVYYSLERGELKSLKRDLDKIGGKKTLYCFTLDPLGLDKQDFQDWKDVSLEPIPQKILDVYEDIYEY
ncbi:MAG: site-specific DNA-methyltransferase [Candidatus Saganbacteria bacterium]|nr:site-specific DNA-methyltransferase [Candidatus Saganbacteria bacterium]